MARKSLSTYASLMHPDFRPNWHHRTIAGILEKVANYEEGWERIIINMPPRAGKTELANKLFPGWFMAKHPYSKFVAATYGDDLSAEIGRHSREYVKTELYKGLFNLGVSKSADSVRNWELSNHASFFATSVGGPLLGKGANCLSIDDPTKNRDDADSKLVQDSIWNWFTTTAYTRLERQNAIVLIMQRWSTADLAGRLIEADDSWRIFSFPMIAEKDEHYRKKGEILWKDRWTEKQIDTMRKLLSERDWQALYQQRPVPEGGAMFESKNFCYYDPADLANITFSLIIQSYDTAVSKRDKSAYSCCTTWGLRHHDSIPTGSGFYLLDVWRKRVSFPELRTAAPEIYKTWNPDIIYIEELQTGKPLIDELKLVLPVRIVGIKPRGIRGGNEFEMSAKEKRALACSSFFENGRVFFPSEAPWLPKFLSELKDFPHTRFCDQVDSLTQGLSQLNKEMYRRRRSFGLGTTYDSDLRRISSIYGR